MFAISFMSLSFTDKWRDLVNATYGGMDAARIAQWAHQSQCARQRRFCGCREVVSQDKSQRRKVSMLANRIWRLHLKVIGRGSLGSSSPPCATWTQPKRS